MSAFHLSFTVNPLAYKWRAIDQFEALQFASAQEAHRLHVEICDLGEVYDGVLRVVFQLGLKRAEVFGAYPADESNGRRAVIRVFFDPQRLAFA